MLLKGAILFHHNQIGVHEIGVRLCVCHCEFVVSETDGPLPGLEPQFFCHST